MIDLNALAIFAKVVESGSFTSGAAALGLPKGSVSRKVSALEAQLGVRLLNRTTRKLSLTEIGRTYYDQCRKGLGELDDANRLISGTRSEPFGVLRLSAPADFTGGSLALWVEAYLKRYEQAKVELVLSDQYVDLIEQRIDLAFRTGRLQDSSFVARNLSDSRRVLCASANYVAERGEPQSLDALQGHDLIVHGNSVDGAVWTLKGTGGDIRVPAHGRVAGHSMGFVLNAAVAGLGIALIPEPIARSNIKDGTLVQVLADYASPEQGLYAVYPSNRQVSANVRTFLDLVVEMIADDGSQEGRRA